MKNVIISEYLGSWYVYLKILNVALTHAHSLSLSLVYFYTHWVLKLNIEMIVTIMNAYNYRIYNSCWPHIESTKVKIHRSTTCNLRLLLLYVYIFSSVNSITHRKYSYCFHIVPHQAFLSNLFSAIKIIQTYRNIRLINQH